ncbi:MAG: hypothetical protein HON43_07635 [Alphaproteobacteria bacterium]|jgi:lipopolysaccharide export system protein LptA|nr:hypothetical protein [Alphaproteobacteria bacterium]MBT5389192.1 hypothetical protein [Alphaproteobacteria bacterium]MBT5540372.1 hypothetical protein [Alphaproteobacteria bacterium]
MSKKITIFSVAWFGLFFVENVVATGLPIQSRGAQPVHIEADEVTYDQDNSLAIGSGNAFVQKGDQMVYGDILTAYFRPKKTSHGGDEGEKEIWKVVAKGHVRIVTPTGKGFGEDGEYNLDKGSIVLKGHGLKAVSGQGTVLAKDSLEYMLSTNQIIARGDAIVKKEDQVLRAPLVTAYFHENEQNELVFSHAVAKGGAILNNSGQIAQGNEAYYDTTTEETILSGSVRVTEGSRQLRGEHGSFDSKTGVSRVVNTKAQNVGTRSNDSRVQVLLYSKRAS